MARRSSRSAPAYAHSRPAGSSPRKRISRSPHEPTAAEALQALRAALSALERALAKLDRD
jgi:hypothetical protein